MPTPAIPAIWMRGGTSKGLFFEPTDLPADAATRDALLLRAMGSPDPYGKQIDGLGGATSSTSKVVLVGASRRTDCDVDYWFGQVPISAGPIDWSGNCGNLTAAVGPFAVWRGLVAAPASGECRVRIWQANIGRRIVAGFPVRDGRPVEQGDFRLDGVAFPAAPVRLDFLDPAGGDDMMMDGGGHFDFEMDEASVPDAATTTTIVPVAPPTTVAPDAPATTTIAPLPTPPADIGPAPQLPVFGSQTCVAQPTPGLQVTVETGFGLQRNGLLPWSQ